MSGPPTEITLVSSVDLCKYMCANWLYVFFKINSTSW